MGLHGLKQGYLYFYLKLNKCIFEGLLDQGPEPNKPEPPYLHMGTEFRSSVDALDMLSTAHHEYCTFRFPFCLEADGRRLKGGPTQWPTTQDTTQLVPWNRSDKHLHGEMTYVLHMYNKLIY
jgi:hypothetical protein